MLPSVLRIYWERLGRRESWLIPLHTICFLVLCWSSSAAQGLLDASPPSVWLLTLTITALTAATAAGDIATDAWAACQMSDSRVSVCQAVGLTIGFEGSMTLFFFLLGKGLVTLTMLLRAMSTIALVTLSMFPVIMQQKHGDRSTKQEPADADAGHCDSVRAVLRRVWGLLKSSSNLRWLLSFLLLIPVSTGHGVVLSTRYQRLGFTPEMFAEYELCLIPMSFAVVWIAGKCAKTKRLLSALSYAIALDLVLNILALAQYEACKDVAEACMSSRRVRIQYVILSQARAQIDTIKFVLKMTFYNRIGQKHKALAATVITFLASVSNFGESLQASLAPLASEVFGFDVTAYACLGCGVLLLLAYWNRLRSIEDLDCPGWLAKE
eukprot:TRINITY_DN40873_c0_g1_i2.p1 TRINITY_DN40873_c0_g1~~TRINITY_DN40873_c0_g1_i2.p1  ORF type:complete len:381 (+),score=38.41 TRINITY_DN40873_c0_g1_i2:67-1209(+)